LENQLFVEALHCSDVLDSLGGNFSGFFKQFRVSQLLAKCHFHFKIA
jgi:hypothetical protein